jgi:hypothetical protein
MKRAEFLNLPIDAQASWVTHSFPDYQMQAYEDSCFFGMFYKVRDDQINSYISNREYFETLDILRDALPEFSDHRATEIEAGAPLTKSEIAALKQHIADKDVSGWTGVHGWNLQCDDGEVFVLFWGHSEGQFGIRLEYVRAYETKKQAFEWLDTFEIQSYL